MGNPVDEDGRVRDLRVVEVLLPAELPEAVDVDRHPQVVTGIVLAAAATHVLGDCSPIQGGVDNVLDAVRDSRVTATVVHQERVHGKQSCGYVK